MVYQSPDFSIYTQLQKLLLQVHWLTRNFRQFWPSCASFSVISFTICDGRSTLQPVKDAMLAFLSFQRVA